MSVKPGTGELEARWQRPVILPLEVLVAQPIEIPISIHWQAFAVAGVGAQNVCKSRRPSHLLVLF